MTSRLDLPLLIEAARQQVRTESDSCRVGLEQIAAILTDAVRNLASVVVSVDTHLSQHASDWDRLCGQLGDDAGEHGKWSPSQRVRGELNVAVRALQFEDLARQIIARSLSGLERLRSIDEALAHLASGDPAALAPARALLSDASAQAERASHAVSQTSVEEGSVELF